jgi:hypothetical protein
MLVVETTPNKCITSASRAFSFFLCSADYSSLLLTVVKILEYYELTFVTPCFLTAHMVTVMNLMTIH